MLSSLLDSLVRHRRFHCRMTEARLASNKLASVNSNKLTNKYEIFSTAGQQLYRQATTLKRAIQAATKLTAQYPETVISIWSPTRGHVWQAIMNDNQLNQLHPRVAQQVEQS